jgi:hypothetical protein
MAPDEAGDDIHIVLFDQLVGHLLAGFRREPVIAIDDFQFGIAGLAAEMFKRKITKPILTGSANAGALANAATAARVTSFFMVSPYRYRGLFRPYAPSPGGLSCNSSAYSLGTAQ